MTEQKFEVLSTHELIQAQHNKNKAEYWNEQRARTFKDVEGNPLKMDDMTSMKIMLQAIMDKLKGLNDFVRQHIHGLNHPTNTYNGQAEKSNSEVKLNELSNTPTLANPGSATNYEKDIRSSEEPI